MAVGTMLGSQTLAQSGQVIQPQEQPEMSGSFARSSTAQIDSGLSLFNLSDFQKQILKLLKADQNDQAADLIRAAISKAKPEDAPELLSLLAYAQRDAKEFKDSIKTLDQLDDLDKASNVLNVRQKTMVQKRLADCFYSMRKPKDAITHYEKAFALMQGVESKHSTRIAVLDPLVAILTEQNRLTEAEKYGEQLVAVADDKAKTRKVVDLGQLFWAEFQLSQVYKAAHSKTKLAELTNKLELLLNTLLEARAEAFTNLTLSERIEKGDRFNKELLQTYVTRNDGKSLAEHLWLTAEFRMRTLPLIAWLPQTSAEPKAALVCVHGLGLENRAFETFGIDMAKRNFAVYAMDVRGFGAWQNVFGRETVNFDRAVSDIGGVVRLVERRHPGMQIFLLGESMGGALVLSSASQYPEKIAGVISSVPSAERFGNQLMAFEVAVNLLRDPNRPFDIGDEIGPRFSSDEEVLELWKKNPKSKSRLSALELIKFDMFMKKTKGRCKSIRSTPLMVVQGLDDQLVKPHGTYRMFNNVKSKDKTMIVMGSAQHLIFETPQQSEILLDGLTAWLNNHVDRAKAIAKKEADLKEQKLQMPTVQTTEASAPSISPPGNQRQAAPQAAK